MSQKRKQGLVDFIYQHLDTKFVAKGSGSDSISYPGVLKAFDYIEAHSTLRRGVRGEDLANNLWYVVREVVGFEWAAIKSESGGGQGKWNKRMLTALRNEYSSETVKNLTEKDLGDVIAPYKVDHHEVIFDFTCTFDWEKGSFGDHSSCYWPGGSYEHLRLWMQENGFIAVRMYDGDGETGVGRCFIVPTNDGEIGMFNAYGMQLIEYAEMVKNFIVQEHLMPVEPKIVNISLRINEDGYNKDVHPNNLCFLITGKDDVNPGDRYYVEFGDYPDACSRCGKPYEVGSRTSGSNWLYDKEAKKVLCYECQKQGANCFGCRNTVYEDFTQGNYVCRGEMTMQVVFHKQCLEDLPVCPRCGNKADQLLNLSVGGQASMCCGLCVNNLKAKYCSRCSTYTDAKMYIVDGDNMCAVCKKDHPEVGYCQICREWRTTTEERADGVKACKYCIWHCKDPKHVGGKVFSRKAKAVYTKVGKYSSDYICPACVERRQEADKVKEGV